MCPDFLISNPGDFRVFGQLSISIDRRVLAKYARTKILALRDLKGRNLSYFSYH